MLVLYVGAAVYQVLVRIFNGRENAGFDATLRVYAYTAAVDLLAWIPVVGYAASLYGFFLAFLGIREVHSTTTGRALGVVLVPLVFWLVLIFGASIPQFARG
ncbi:MAG: YIP1 family protein [Actinomycetota bacterium]|nr:YIP1 family protein [Actinomycetota bacterium]